MANSAPIVLHLSAFIYSVDPPGVPTGLMCMTIPRGQNVTWEPVLHYSCAMSNVTYSVTANAENDMITTIEPLSLTDTTAELTNTMGLQPNTRYIIWVGAITTTGGCEGIQANVSCVTFPDLLITPPPPGTYVRNPALYACIVSLLYAIIIVSTTVPLQSLYEVTTIIQLFTTITIVCILEQNHCTIQ